MILLRIVLKRESAGMNQRDLLVVVLLADAVQNGMAGGYDSVGNALVVAVTLIFWDYVLSWVLYHWPAARRLFEPAPLELIRDGRVVGQNLEHEPPPQEELLGRLREEGIENPAEVRLAIMETNGRISVLPWDARRPRRPPERPTA